MNCPFKVGDKVVCMDPWHTDIENTHDVHTVTSVQQPTSSDPASYIRLESFEHRYPSHCFKANRYRAAVAGIDYPLERITTPVTNDLYPSGHLSDGSSVQKHSAGELYPYVVAYRDAQDKFITRKYDVGLIGPRVVGTAWFTSFEDAVAAATALKG